MNINYKQGVLEYIFVVIKFHCYLPAVGPAFASTFVPTLEPISFLFGFAPLTEAALLKASINSYSSVIVETV